MDKLAAGIVDKLNIIGFFNVILSGGVFLYGLSPILGKYAPQLFYAALGLSKDIEIAVVLGVACYIIGCALQSIQELLFKGLKASIANRCLVSADMAANGVQKKNVLSNTYRREELIELATRLFSKKELGAFDPNDKEMCSYFLDYCDYSNSIRGFDGKADRLNESAAFFEQLAIAFYMLAVVGLFIVVFAKTGEWIYCIGYLIMGCIFTNRSYRYRLNWARTVLSTYEAVNDLSASDK